MDSEESPQVDFGSILAQIGQVKSSLQQAQEVVAAQVVEGSAGGGAVKITVNGALEFLDVTIAPSVVDPDDVEMLQDLILAAVRDSVEKASELANSSLSGLGDLGSAFGGLDLGGLLDGP